MSNKTIYIPGTAAHTRHQERKEKFDNEQKQATARNKRNKDRRRQSSKEHKLRTQKNNPENGYFGAGNTFDRYISSHCNEHAIIMDTTGAWNELVTDSKRIITPDRLSKLYPVVVRSGTVYQVDPITKVATPKELTGFRETNNGQKRVWFSHILPAAYNNIRQSLVN
jgi:hypothetical protein